MKKFITFVFVSFLSVMNMMAADSILWEGDWAVSWDFPEGDEHREWKGIGQENFAAFEVGQVVSFYLKADVAAEYHKYQIDNWSWEQLPGQEGVVFSADTIVKLEITQEIKDAVAAKGFAIHGHGFNITQATVSEKTSEPEVNVLWEGDWAVSWDFPEGDEHREWKGIGQENFAAFEVGQIVSFYLKADATAAYHKYQIDNWSWVQLPGQVGTDFDSDVVVKLNITQEIKNAVAANGFAIHGHGFSVTKATITLLPTSITVLGNVNNLKDSGYYTINGTRVTKPTKGLYIKNGKKYLVR